MDWRRFPHLVRAQSLEAPKLQPLLPLLSSEQAAKVAEKQLYAPEWQINPDLFRTRVSPDQPA
jgi:hypothetical protein